MARDRYAILWSIGTILSFVLYYSGVAACYLFLRRKIFKRFRSVVLTYHRINDGSEDSYISVSTLNFRRQMKYLKENFEVVRLDELINDIKHKDIRRDRVSITFDDGYRDNYTKAYPVLKELGLPATIFVSTGYIGGDNRLSKDEIRDMKNGGVDFGSHTVTHPVLTKISIEEAAKEISDSKKDVENLLNEKIDYFAYPLGKKNHFDNQISDIVKRTGYKAAFTTENGEIDYKGDPFSLKRIGIRNCHLFVFKVRVSGIFERIR